MMFGRGQQLHYTRKWACPLEALEWTKTGRKKSCNHVKQEMEVDVLPKEMNFDEDKDYDENYDDDDDVKDNDDNNKDDDDESKDRNKEFDDDYDEQDGKALRERKLRMEEKQSLRMDFVNRMARL